MHVIVIRMNADKSAQLAFRVEPELVKLADEVADLIAETSITRTRPTQAEVLRAALRRGLDAMKADIDKARAEAAGFITDPERIAEALFAPPRGRMTKRGRSMIRKRR